MRGGIAVWSLIFSITGAILPGQVHLQGGGGLMFMPYDPLTVEHENLGILHCGFTADLLVTVNRTFELGAEFGIYQGLSPGVLIVYCTATGIPLDVLVRMNLAPDRKAALELRAGLWISSFAIEAIWGDSISVTESRFNAGGRLVVGAFYFGVDYVSASPTWGASVAFEAGLKWST